MAVTWQVTGDTPDQYQFDAAGNPTVGHVVAFLTGNGGRGTVFVPEDHYNPDTVRTLIAAKAATVDQIGSLTSDTK